MKFLSLLSVPFLLLGTVAGAQISIVSNSVMEQGVKPGDRFDGTLLIRNSSGVPQEARVYQTSYGFFADGRTSYGAPAGSARSNATWIRFAPDHLVVPAGATVPVSYSVSVPSSDSLRGTYWSVLMVEGTPPASDAAQKGARPSLGLRMSTRYATQIATTIVGGAPKVAFDSAVTSTTKLGRSLRLDVLNTGDVAMRLHMSVEIYSETGSLVAKAEQQRGLVYPGTSFRQVFDLGPLPAGSYRAVVAGDAGLEELFGGQFRIRY